ncbi:MAG: transposase, partial [Actinophytocola sp.]|nr:transposase [Actinophytocola sp.]
NSSGIVDGAAAVLIGSKKAGRAADLKARARIEAFANIGSEPAMMLTGPMEVTEKVLKRAKMTCKDIDLFELNEAAHATREQGLRQIPPDILDPLLKRWRHAILCGLASHPRRDGRKQTKTRNLLERLRDRADQVLRFARDPTLVPFTNNQAERDLRPAKTQIKISGCHRSQSGAQAWLRVRGYISTVRKHDTNVLTALRDATNGNPWTPPVPAGT